MSGEPTHEMTIERGTKVGRFVVIAQLGSGGMGVVFAAHDPDLDRQVALKVLRGDAGEEEDRIRMQREAQAMARLTHPNVITVYEVGAVGGIVFVAQELLDGGTLRDWLDKRPPRPELLAKFLAAGRGLAAAHAAGLVHRDFKPENVLLGTDGRVRVADFGLARAVGALPESLAATTRGGGPPRDDDVTRSPMSPLTHTGAVMGTPRYMAPEQHRGERADARSDQFGFCVALYHAVYGDWPFPGTTAVALADAVIHGRLRPPPSGARVAPRLKKLIERGLSTDPAARYPSMDALLAELAQLVEPEPRRSSRVPLLVGALVLVAGAAVGGYVLVTQRGDKHPDDVEKPTPVTLTPDEQELATKTGIEWLTSAIDRGQLDDAIVKYDLAAKAAKLPAHAATAQAAAAFVLVLRGKLDKAEAQLQQAKASKGSDPLATAYVDMTTAALAGARGELRTALELSDKCAKGFATAAPVLAAMCHQIHGDAAADGIDPAGARRDYETGLALATRHSNQERISTLKLALAQLALDDQQRDDAARVATELQTTCEDRDAVGCEVHARILLARVRLGDGETQQALELLEPVKPERIQAFRVRMAHQIALGEVNGLMNEVGKDGITGLDRIDAARADAEKHGMWGLALEAKLARVRVRLAHSVDGAQAEYEALVKEAHSRGLDRIARLATAYFDELHPQR